MHELHHVIWLCEFLFGKKGHLQIVTFHEIGSMEVWFFDNGGNKFHQTHLPSGAVVEHEV